MSLLNIDMSALAQPGTFDDIIDLCCTTNPAGVRLWDLSKIATLPDGRPLHDESLQSMCKIFLYITDAGNAPNQPCSMQVGMAARGEGGSQAEVDLRMKRALCQALVEYLWRCEGRGGMQTGSGFLLLPALASTPVLASSGEGAAGPSIPEASPSAASAGVVDLTHKRQLAELSSAVDELEDRRSLADGLGQGSQPEQKRSMIYVSIPDKVSPVCVSLGSHAATHAIIASFSFSFSRLCLSLSLQSRNIFGSVYV